MSQLLSRYYQTVYVHFVPFRGLLPHGTEETITRQIQRLRRKIVEFSGSVQTSRQTQWMRYDAKLLSIIFGFAFAHVATRTDESFDFLLLRRQADVADSVETSLASFLDQCLQNCHEANFTWAAEVVASSFVRRALQKIGLGKPSCMRLLA
jgi:hypothetical protein